MRAHQSSFFHLPTDLVTQVLSFCDALSLCEVAACSRFTNQAFLRAIPALSFAYVLRSDELQAAAFARLAAMRSCKITILSRTNNQVLRLPPNTVRLMIREQCVHRHAWPADVPLPPRLSFLETDLILPPLHNLPLQYLSTHVLPPTLPLTLKHLSVQSLTKDEHQRLMRILPFLPRLRHLCLGTIQKHRCHFTLLFFF